MVELEACFDREDRLFAFHPTQEQNAFEWLAKLRSQQVGWPDIRAEIDAFLREDGCSEDHIAEQIEVARSKFEPWLPDREAAMENLDPANHAFFD